MTRARWLSTFGALVLAACNGPTGDFGRAGSDGKDGTDGDNAESGSPGSNGLDGQNGPDGVWLDAYETKAGLDIELLDVTLAGDVVRVEFRLTDATGTPLDREGHKTEGAVSTSFVLGWLDELAPGDPLQYQALTTRVQTSPITDDSAVQPAADDGGAFEEIDRLQGLYAYELATGIAANEANKTHTVGVYASRDFEGARYVDNEVLHFRPDGEPVVTTREVAETTTCNRCHNPLAVHGGRRRAVELCVMCHTSDVVDPDTGNSVDMKEMIHKIHRGHDLPSVVAGTPYQIIGFEQRVHDYSTVAFPQPMQNCATCHTGKDGDLWVDRPGRIACGSCHDDTSFEAVVPPGMVAHIGGPQADDTECATCHQAGGTADSIEANHLTVFSDPNAPELSLSIVSVENTGPGQVPQVVFSAAQDGVPLDILATPIDRIRVTVAGPTTDYAGYVQYTIQGSGASGTLAADPNGFRYTLPAPMDLAATGSYAFGMEGRVNVGGTNYNAKNPVAYAPVTDAVAAPRRAIVDDVQCNNCHDELSLHGGSRRSTEYCVMCHHANNVGDERISRLEGSVVTAESVDMRVFIHKIHTGERLEQQPYILGGFPPPDATNPAGTPIDFGEVRYPGDMRDCGTCHIAGTFSLPLAGPNLLPTHAHELTCNELPAADGDDYCDDRSVTEDRLFGPAGSACTSCHDASGTLIHAMSYTLPDGNEDCATCHGTGDAYDAFIGHQLDP